MIQYFDETVHATQHEDMQVIIQNLKGMIGKQFSMLNYYKEIPVSYDASLLSVENEMAEFQIHEYQAKVIKLEHQALIYCPDKNLFHDDLLAEAFYVSVPKKRVILRKFGFAKIRSDMRRFVRVVLDRPVAVDFILENDILSGTIRDISLGGAAVAIASKELLVPGSAVNVIAKLPDYSSKSVIEVGLTGTVVRVNGDAAPYICLLEFHPEKHSQQQIAYFVNQRQVEIIKELKYLDE